MSVTTGTFPGIRIFDMPDLGAVTDTSSLVGEHAGSGRVRRDGVPELQQPADDRPRPRRPRPAREHRRYLNRVHGRPVESGVTPFPTCDFRKQHARNTLSTGYVSTQELAANFAYLKNTSGWNQNAGDNDGTHRRRRVSHQSGQLRTSAIASRISSTAMPRARNRAPRTGPRVQAISAYYADMHAMGAAHVYLNPV